MKLWSLEYEVHEATLSLQCSCYSERRPELEKRMWRGTVIEVGLHKIESEKFYLVICSSVDCPFVRLFSAPIDSGFHPQSLFELRVSWY